MTTSRRQRLRITMLVVVALAPFLFATTSHAEPTGIARHVGELPGVEPAPGVRDVALTFDDGPDPWAVPQVLAILHRYGVPGTFFVSGVAADANPALIESIARSGAVVAGHGWVHRSLTALSDDDIERSVRRTDGVLRDLTGRAPACVRPPNGAVSERVVTVLRRLGKTPVLWSVDPQDWRAPGVEAITSSVLAAVRPGAVVLLHPGGGVRAQTVAALPSIIEGLRARGYRFVSVCGTGTDVRSIVLAKASPGAPVWPAPPIFSAAAPVGVAATPAGRGAWVAGADGGVLTVGDAPFVGSLGGQDRHDITGIASTSSGHGYWLATEEGRIASFGDASVVGPVVPSGLRAPIVGMARGVRGGWLVAADGGVFAFGGAPFLGSLGGLRLNAPIVGMAASPTGRGYWLAGADGGVFSFGDAHFAGSIAAQPGTARVVGLASTSSGRGYWLLTDGASVVAFGDAVPMPRVSVAAWDHAAAIVNAARGCWIVLHHPAVRQV